MIKAVTISVLMPVYNGAKYLKQAIDSLLAQTFNNFEIVILDDGSTDNSEEVIRSYSDPRIKLIINEKNQGLIYTLNQGLKTCQGEFIARMDQDDICMPDRFAKQLQFLQGNPNISLVGTFADVIDGNNNFIEHKESDTEYLRLKYHLFKGNPFTHSSIFFRKQDILDIGAYASPYIGAEDYEMYTRIVTKYRVAVLPEVLMKYRIHGNQITQDPETYAERVEVLDKIQHKYINTFINLSWSDFEQYKNKSINLEKKIFQVFISQEKLACPKELKRFTAWHQEQIPSLYMSKIKSILKRTKTVLLEIVVNKVSGKISSAGGSAIKNENCTAPEVDTWQLSEFILNKTVPVISIHPFPLNEQMLMVSALCLTKPTHVFEWGTHIGKSARLFSEAIDYFNINCHIHSIDLPDEVEHGEHPKNDRGKLVKDKKNVTLHQGDGVETALKIIQGNKSQGKYLFYVDGDHSYDSVSRELKEIHNNVPDASILLHDTFFQSKESGYNIGPFKAIKDFLADNSDQYRVYSTRLGLPGMTLLLKK